MKKEQPRIYEGVSLDGVPLRVTVERGEIKKVDEIAKNSNLPRILPALVDLQQNGALGFPYNTLSENASETLNKIASHLLKNGVGRVFATFTTAPYDVLNTAAASFDTALQSDEKLNGLFCGIFHEGVFISPEPGWRGGHDPHYIQTPDWKIFDELNRKSGNRIKMVNIAPEEPGAMEFIDKAVEQGIIVALGHCAPDTKTINEAVDRGAGMVTHFANGAAPSIHRFQNPFWGMMNNEKLALGLIGDGFHLPPEVVGTALKVKGTEDCFMVSDANAFSGCAPGLYKRLGGTDFIIEENGFIHLPDSELLAGAWFQQNRSVEYLVNDVGLNFEEAWRLCSTTPARLADIHLPTIAVGEEATFVLANFADGKLRIHQSIFQGLEQVGNSE